MLDTALKLLKEITSHSYKAYIVGGFVRDHLLGIESKKDILNDIRNYLKGTDVDLDENDIGFVGSIKDAFLKFDLGKEIKTSINKTLKDINNMCYYTNCKNPPIHYI